MTSRSSTTVRKSTPTGTPISEARARRQTNAQIERLAVVNEQHDLGRQHAMSATRGAAVWMPTAAVNSGIDTRASPKPVRLWVKTARKDDAENQGSGHRPADRSSDQAAGNNPAGRV
jgi:hypothetical protein